MKIKISKTTTEEVEVQFPMYVKNEFGVAKLISEKRALMVTSVLNHYSINTYYASSVLPNIKEPATQEEFETIFNQAFESLRKEFIDESN